MNIFYTDHDPILAAQNMGDKHVVKMLLETAQILSSAHRILDGDSYADMFGLYRKTHVNHPCVKWVISTAGNYFWLYDHYVALCEEFNYRYDKQHKSSTLKTALQYPPDKIEHAEFFDPPSCMDREYIISDDTTKNYKNYYKIGKSHLHKWSRRQPPDWI